MNSPRVKICGLTCLEDSLAAIHAGADLLGFNFYPPSPRAISALECETIIAKIQPFLEQPRGRVCLVGVFVNHPVREIRQILDGCGLNLAQLSGDESPADFEALGECAYKALRPSAGEKLEDLALRYRLSAAKNPPPSSPAVLVDAYVARQYGGTGQFADWEQAQALARRMPLLLAGGLTPENVERAIRYVQPWGIDTASGIESSPGRKDPVKMKLMISRVRAVSNNFATKGD